MPQRVGVGGFFLGFHWAIQVALSKGFTKVILEIDLSILVDAFLHNKELFHIRGLFLHIRQLCCSLLRVLAPSCDLEVVK